MNILYYNSKGEVSFSGGGAFSFRLTDTDGLWLASKKVTTVSYAGTPGQCVTESIEGARTITISGDLYVDGGIQATLSEKLSILNTDGTLQITAGNAVREIKCRLSSAEQGDRDGAYQQYVFQFICDDPFFTDTTDTTVPLYQLDGHIDAYFDFSEPFSTLIAGGNLNYIGSAPTEPVITINVQSVTGDTSPENGFSIENTTTGQRIQLDYEPSAGELITIDIPSRKIYNADGDDLLQYISDGTFLNGFTLLPGENVLTAQSYNIDADVIMECVYKNKYVEAAW